MKNSYHQKKSLSEKSVPPVVGKKDFCDYDKAPFTPSSGFVTNILEENPEEACKRLRSIKNEEHYGNYSFSLDDEISALTH